MIGRRLGRKIARERRAPDCEEGAKNSGALKKGGSKLGNAIRVDVSGHEADSTCAATNSILQERGEGTLSEFGSVPESIETLATELNAQTLAPIPFEPSPSAPFPNGFRHVTPSTQEESRLVFQSDPQGFAAEQFRLLRRTLSHEFEAGGVLLITSPGMGDGKTLTSVNLCSCLADAGHTTLLVEADIRRPTIREVLSCMISPPGIEDALRGTVEPCEAVHCIQTLNLCAAMVVKAPLNPSQLISGPGLKNLLAWARKRFRWVVLDAPPVLSAADVSEILPFADAALLVVRAHATPKVLSKRAIEMLGKRLSGVIFNEVTVDSNPDYQYLSHYYTQAEDAKPAGFWSEKKSTKK